MDCKNCKYLEYDDRADQYWCGLDHIGDKPLKKWINGINTPIWCKKDYKDLLGSWNEIHDYITRCKTDYVDNITTYTVLEEIGDLMEYYEIPINNRVLNPKMIEKKKIKNYGTDPDYLLYLNTQLHFIKCPFCEQTVHDSCVDIMMVFESPFNFENNIMVLWGCKSCPNKFTTFHEVDDNGDLIL